MGTPQIQCNALTKNFPRRNSSISALEDINLTIQKGEYVIIKGRSGAGKSTLLSLMSGLTKPTKGEVLYEGENISTMSNGKLSQLLSNNIGIIFQNLNLLPAYTVFENIEIAMDPMLTDHENRQEYIMQILSEFQLAEKSHLFPSELSLGQQQKVAIARTLAKKPKIIFADEPTGSIDEISANEIANQLLYLNKEKKVTMVIATHGIFPALNYDKIIHIENGKQIL
jgi:putative ABC transport system ATP-binding protein